MVYAFDAAFSGIGALTQAAFASNKTVMKNFANLIVVGKRMGRVV